MPGPGGTLFLDLSLTTGWAYGSKGEQPSSGIWRLAGGINDVGQAMSSLTNVLQHNIQQLCPAKVRLCRTLSIQQTSARMLIALEGLAEMVAWEEGVHFDHVSEMTVRKTVLGRARLGDTNACKRAVLNWAKASGHKPVDHNAADALVGLHYCLVFGSAKVMGGKGAGASML